MTMKMNKKKEIQRRYGSNMPDAQYLAVGYALDDLQEHIIEKAIKWMEENLSLCKGSEAPYILAKFRKAMEE